MTIEPVRPRGPLVAILAAGSARRFGGGKLDARLGQRALGAWALGNALESGFEVAAVTGTTPPAFALEAQTGSGVRLIENPHATTGMGTSVAAAARAAVAGGHAGLIILLADMPFVMGRDLDALIDPARATFARQADDRPGPPAWIPERLLPRLYDLTGERGARSVLAADEFRLIEWPPDQLVDIDTSDALAQARRMIDGRQRTATASALPDVARSIG